VDVDNAAAVSRRSFLRNMGVAAFPCGPRQSCPKRWLRLRRNLPLPQFRLSGYQTPTPTEDLVRELHAGLSNEQKRLIMFPWNHGASASGSALCTAFTMPLRPTHRPGLHPSAARISRSYSRSMTADDDSFRRINTVIQADTTDGLAGSGADIFGDPTGNSTLRVFSLPPITSLCAATAIRSRYRVRRASLYGHSLSGLNERNAFNFQTRAVRTLYDALSEEQRQRSRIVGTPGENLPSIQFRAHRPTSARIGIVRTFRRRAPAGRTNHDVDSRPVPPRGCHGSDVSLGP